LSFQVDESGLKVFPNGLRYGYNFQCSSMNWQNSSLKKRRQRLWHNSNTQSNKANKKLFPP